MEEKQGKQSTVIAIAVVIVLLVIGGLFYQRSIDKERKSEEEQQTTEQTKIAKEAESKRREMATQAPSAPVRTEPLAAPPAPPPSTGQCAVDAPQVIQARMAAAPEGMVYVAAGPFTMGNTPEAGQPDESPVHGVCLRGFYIDKYEVTNEQFKKFVDATGYITDAEMAASSNASLPTWKHPYGADSNADNMSNYPVACVSWNDANAYALWAGKRLPTESEWEKAARGTDGRVYPWGNAEPTIALANVADSSAGLMWSNASLSDNQKKAAPVGSFAGGRSVYAVEDMAGNVWEWCFDWWGKDYYKVSPPTGPTGPETGEFKVIRGGSWFYSADGARTSRRMYFRPVGSSADIGFRCVKDMQ
ncbi:formylglycine-generating enzyme family protein [Candidatus Poribacteria bacterium]|nr:formylglycine-generating enzyme family protein [Candidatus Poribacteria bacterium]